MSSISGVSSGSSSGWAQLAATRAANQAKMQEWLLSEADADGSGGIDTSELQTVLDGVSEKTGVKLDISASDLLAQADSDGNGTLGAAELGQAMQSVLPPPPSTMEFAQGRSGEPGQAGDDLFSKVDADGNGSIDESELATLMQKMSGSGNTQASNATDATDASTELFAKLDTDGDGSLTQAEFDAGRPGSAGGPQGAGGMPPPPPGGMGGAGGAASASNSETYDPLDTNEDGIVSAAELAAGEAAGATSSTVDTLNALFDAIDTDGDHKLSSSETDAFAQQVAAALQTMQSSASSSSDSSTASNEEKKPFDLQTLAQLVLKQYQAIAENQSATASTGTLVDASA